MLLLTITNLCCVLAIVTLLFFLPRHTLFSFIHCLSPVGLWPENTATIYLISRQYSSWGGGRGEPPPAPAVLGEFCVDQLKMVGECCDNEDELTEVNQKEPVLHACEYCCRNMSDAGASDSSFVERLKNALTKHGTVLFRSCESTETLLKKLDRLEILLSKVFQGYKELMEMQLQQSKESLIANELIRHPELDVRVSVASCISQIIRITPPDEPFEEDQMEEFFRLAISAFENLSYLSGRVYIKAVSILGTMSYSKSCLVMLDLKMDPTISLMFNLFLDGIRTSHPKEVFSNMENIMTMIICNAEDTDEFLFELVKIILNSLRRENQNVSPASFQLAENTFKNCSGFLKAFLSEVGRCLDVPIEYYAEVVVSFFQDAIQRENTDLKGTVGDLPCLGESGLAIESDLCNLTEGNETQTPEDGENCKDNRVMISHFSDDTDKKGKSTNMPQEEIPKEIHGQRKRRRRPNSLKKAEEGYDPFWMLVDWKSMENSPSENSKMKTNGSAKTTISKELSSKSAGNPKPSNKIKVSDRNEEVSGIEAFNLNSEGNIIVSEGQCGDLTVKNPSEKEQRSSTNLASVKKSRGKTTVSEDLKEDVVNHSEIGRGSSTEVASVKRSRGKTIVSEDLKEDIVVNQSEKGQGSSTDVAIVEKSRGKTILYEDRKENYAILAPQCRLTSSKAKALSRKVSKCPKRKRSAIGPFRGEVIGCRIKVWWQLDRKFYKGTITHYDPETNHHVVEYDDGDIEQLVLEEECWEMLPGHKLSAHDQEVGADSTSSKSEKE